MIVPASEPSPSAEIGKASWYADSFQGKRTASGERYDKHAFTAAHRTLPLGSYVMVKIYATDAVCASKSMIVAPITVHA